MTKIKEPYETLICYDEAIGINRYMSFRLLVINLAAQVEFKAKLLKRIFLSRMSVLRKLVSS